MAVTVPVTTSLAVTVANVAESTASSLAVINLISPESASTLPVRLPVTLPLTSPVTLPVNAAEIVPALKLPDASRATIAEPVLLFVAVVALLLTLPAVAIVSSFVSSIAALALTSSFTITPEVIAEEIVMFEPPLNAVAVPVTSPLIAISLDVSRSVAVSALPVTSPVRLPSKVAALTVASV